MPDYDERYVDPAAASEGTGTSGDPYKTIQYGLDNYTHGGSGTRFNIKVGTAASESGLNLATYVVNNGVTSATEPLIFQGYTSSAGDGGIAEVSCGSAANGFTDAGADWDYVGIIDLKIHDTTGTGVWVANNCAILNCQVYDCGADGIHLSDVECIAAGNYVYDIEDEGIQASDDRCYVYRNFVHDTGKSLRNGISMTGHNSHAVENIVYFDSTASVIGLSLTGDDCMVIGNSVFNDLASTGKGINITGRGPVILNNVVEGFSGTGS